MSILGWDGGSSGFKCHLPKREAFLAHHWEGLPGRAAPCLGLCAQSQMPSASTKQEAQGLGSMLGPACSGVNTLNRG